MVVVGMLAMTTAGAGVEGVGMEEAKEMDRVGDMEVAQVIVVAAVVVGEGEAGATVAGAVGAGVAVAGQLGATQNGVKRSSHGVPLRRSHK